MGRRKSNFLEDSDDSDASNSAGDDFDEPFDANDPDAAAERELFNNPHQRGKKRSREDAREDQTYGVWSRESENATRSGVKGRNAQGKKTDFLKPPSFVSAGSKSSKAPRDSPPIDNLAETTKLALEAAAEDEQDVGMELDSEDDEIQAQQATAADDDVNSDSSQDSNSQRENSVEPENSDLAAVPGLAPPKSPSPPPVQPTASLAFAPRGIGAKKSGAGIGLRAGIGGGNSFAAGRGGLGSTNSASWPTAAPVFASATSASNLPLGGTPAATSISGAGSPMASAANSRQGLGAAKNSVESGATSGLESRDRASLANSIRMKLAAEACGTTSSGQSSTSANSSRAESPTAANSDAPRERRSFLPTAAPTPNLTSAPKKLAKKEQQHFAKIGASGSLGLKMMEKMGYKLGTGLGMNEQGIVTPIGEGQKLRKAKAGLASGERSEGSKAEAARMRGEDPDELDDKENKRKNRSKGENSADSAKPVRDAWKQSKRKEVKPKTEYKTYEEILAESGAEPAGVGLLVDLAGNALPSHSLSSLPAYGAASADPTHLPELRHNLTLLTSTLSTTLSALAREGKGVADRRQFLLHEEKRVKTVVETQTQKIERLKKINRIVENIHEIAVNLNQVIKAGESQDLGLSPAELFSPFNQKFDELFAEFAEEYIQMNLDHVIIAAIVPSCRNLFAEWDPLAEPNLGVAELKRWRKYFLIDKESETGNIQAVDVFGSSSRSNGATHDKGKNRSMSSFESLMWTIWLPRIRSAINNSWSASDPDSAISLFTAWNPLLPQFLRDNFLDQLILPKLNKAISEWSARNSVPLHAIVFPWLELAGEDRLENILSEAKRKIRNLLKNWKPSEKVPSGLQIWREAFTTSEWDSAVLKHVLPQLGGLLRDKFIVNPREQDLKPLEKVLSWKTLIRNSMLSQLLEAEFFPKWLDALFIWLTSAHANFEQIAEWYSWWKSYFSDEILGSKSVQKGFRKGLDLMNQAMALGDDAKYRLKRPDTKVKVSSSTSTPKSTARPVHRPQRVVEDENEISFRAIVEEFAAAANLVFLATGKTDEAGHNLYRVSKSVDGKSGVTVYLDDDVVWMLETGEWNPVSVEEMCQRAGR